jgi:hypothetical protein
MKKPICDWTYDEIKHLIDEYTKSGKTEGGDYSLDECKREITRRRMSMRKPICDWTDDEIRNLVQNYTKDKKTDGGHYSLVECQREITRRNGGPYSGREVTSKIVGLGQKSSDGLVTYLELWQAYFPNKQWKGNSSGNEVGKKMLRAASYFCAINQQLPFVTCIVVNGATRKATDKAKKNVFDFAKNLGVSTGPDYIKFFDDHAKRTKSIDPSVFDADPGLKDVD